jgi:hypothetical protein
MPISLPLTTDAHAAQAPESAAVRPGRGSFLHLGLVILLLGLLQSAVVWGRMNPDGISYLDIAGLYVTGEVGAAINSYWSPLYSWILAVPILASDGSGGAAFQVAHAVNLVVLLVALAAFHFLLRAVLDLRVTHGGLPAGQDRLVTFLAFGLLLRFQLVSIPVWLVTPDLLVCAIVFGVSGMVVRHASGDRPRRASFYLAFGALLGFGYLAKTAVFPIAWVFVLALLVSGPPAWARVRGAALALLGFLVVALPWIVVVSEQVGRVTIGESARLNYGWVTGQTTGGGGAGVLDGRGPELVSSEPVAFAFPREAGVTHPPHFDPAGSRYARQPAPAPPGPSSGDENVATEVLPDQQLPVPEPSVSAPVGMLRALLAVVTELQLSRQLPVLGRSASALAGMLGPLLAVGIFLLMAGAWRDVDTRARGPLVALLLTPAAAISMYALIHVEERYLSGFVIASALALFAMLRVDGDRPAAVAARAGVRGLTVLLLLIGSFLFLRDLARTVMVEGTETQRAIAAALEAALPPGEREVALVGNDFQAVYALRLVDGGVVGLVPPQHVLDVWTVPVGQRSEALACLAARGARAAVALDVPRAVAAEGWTRIGDTPYHLLDLRGRATQCPARPAD